MGSRHKTSSLPSSPAGSIPTGAHKKKQGLLVGMVRGTTKTRATNDDHRRPRRHPPSSPSAAAGTSVALRVSRVSRQSKAGKSKTRKARSKLSRLDETKPTGRNTAPSKRADSRTDCEDERSVGMCSVGTGYVKLADRIGIALSESSDSFTEATEETKVTDLFSALVTCSSSAFDGDFVPFPDNSLKRGATASLYLGDAEREAHEDRRFDDDGSRDERYDEGILGALASWGASPRSRASMSYSTPEEEAPIGGSLYGYLGERETREDRHAARTRGRRGGKFSM